MTGKIRGRQSLAVKMVRFLARLPPRLPAWSRTFLRPLSGLYSSVYRRAFSSIGKEVLVTTFAGFKMYIDYSNQVERDSANGTYERDYAQCFASTLRSGDTVIDVGAHVGYFTLLASEAVGESGEVYAFEPNPIYYSKLVRNLAANQVKNVRAFEFGLSDVEERLNLRVPRTNPAEGSIARKASSEALYGLDYAVDSVPIRLTTFDAICRNSGLGKIDLVKIDAEGAELKILKGMTVLKTQRDVSVFIEINPTLLRLLDSNLVELIHLLVEYGFDSIVSVDRRLQQKLRGLDDQGILTTFESFPGNYIFHKTLAEI